ncbi:ABC transporter ATP-binding protein [Erwinia sp. HR93]|uniref:ABC transporter ATP-binding protein n=1 Tax=Erwinia sp. HR93 TaxID=3094840 RepID=UPI002ADEAFEF|nr:ABC transporter ATP-binding protein [Erwinia sp. HR93]MEA1063762.1 ABC transporter ATP-binding protein [Erwinia sp. HR93]
MKSKASTSMLRTFLPFIRKQQTLLAGAFFMLLASSGLRLLEPWPLAFAIDIVMGDAQDNPLLNGFNINQLSHENLLLLCAGGIVAIAALRAAAGYASTIGMALAGSRVMSDIRRQLFAHLLRLPLAFFQRARTGDLTMRLINDIGMMREVTVTAMMPLLSNIIIFVGMLGFMLFLDWKLTLIALVAMPLLALTTFYSSVKIRDVSRAQRKREGNLAAKSSEFMTGIATIQAMSLENAALDTFNGNDAKSMKQNVRSKRLAAGMERRVDLLIAASTSVVVFLGAKSVMNNMMSAGELLIFISYMKNAFRPVREFAKYSGRLSKATTAGERIIELLHTPVAVSEQTGDRILPDTAHDIRFEQVTFHYPANGESEKRAALRDISFHLPAGGSLAITGPSGAGKSTLSQLLLRLYEPCAGRIVIGDRDLREYDIRNLRKQIGYLPQESLLFGVSIRENIALGASGPVTDDEITSAARLANAHDFIIQLPDGYDTVVSERGMSLSGGQRQRIAIARAAIRRNAFLLLDEPGVGLDYKNEREVADALVHLMRGKTSLLITHNLAFAARADRILLLDGGEIIEQGDHQTLMKQQGRYFELWNIQHG